MRKEDEIVARLVAWFDSRLGLSHPMLRPVPEYAVNPFYWLGALTVVAFVIQGVTGVLMMLYYVPSPIQAFQSTQYIFQKVYYGRFLESVHLVHCVCDDYAGFHAYDAWVFRFGSQEAS